MGSSWNVCFFIMVFSSLHGQGILSPTWIKSDSSIHGTSEAWGIDVDQNDHIYWVLSNDNKNQGLDIICYKFDVGGIEIWSNPATFGGAGTQHAYVCNASDSALYIGGRSCPGLVTSCDMLLLKMDKSSGSLIWDRTMNFTANGYDEIDGLEIKPDGIYCGGWCQELNPSIFGSDIGLWKLDFNGNTQWTNSVGVFSTAEHQDGHFVVDSTNIYAAGLWGGKGIGNLYNGHSFLGVFSKSDGTLIDSTLFGSHSNQFNDIENALGMTSDGTYLYVTGYTTPKNSNDWQIFVSKFDKKLNQIWYTDWGGNGSESARGIQVENNVIYVAGLTESGSLISGRNRDAVLLMLDTSGNVLNYQTYGGTDKESFHALAVHNQNIYLTGTVEVENSSKKSMLVALENSTNVLNDNPFSYKQDFIIYPNPSNGRIKVKFLKENHKSGVIQIYNLHGKLISKRDFNSLENTFSFHLDQPGIYFIQVLFPEYRTTKMLINE